MNSVANPFALKILNSHAALRDQKIQGKIDRVFGLMTFSFIVIEAIQYQQGKIGPSGLVLLHVYGAFNISLSTFLKRNPKWTNLGEFLRMGVINQAFAALALVTIKGLLAPFWLLFAYNFCAIGSKWILNGNRKTRIVLQLINLSNLIGWWMVFYRHSAGFLPLLIVAVANFIVAAVSELIFSTLQDSLSNQVEQTAKLQENREEIHEKQKTLETFLAHFEGVAFAKNMDGTFILSNRKANELFGENVLGKKDTDLKAAGLFQDLTEEESLILKSGKTLTVEETLFLSPRSVTYALTHFYLKNGDEPLAICAIGLDITTQKASSRAYETTRANMISASRMSALGEMAGGIAHEVNNPLMVLHARATRLQEAAANGTLEIKQARTDSEKIMQTAERISKIIRSLRSFARNAFDTPFESTPVQSILDETMELCREKLKVHGVEVRIAPFDPQLRLACRAVEVSQLLLNLINNAHDAIEKLPSRWIQIEVFDHDSEIQFAVTDSGNGIPQPLREKILKPFFTTKDVGKGTGLGLSISQGIAASHGGKLILDDNSQHTRFLACFPKQRTQVNKNHDQAA